MTILGLNTIKSIVFQNLNNQTRPLFYWVTLMFNRVDTDRVKQIGPDRACAEWLLRNGAFVRWKGASKYVTDYNTLLSDGEHCYIEAVDANNAGICDVGFEHFKGCNHVKDIKLENCKYIDGDAISYLKILKNTLHNLEIINCKSIDDEGLRNVKVLKNLKTLKIRGLPYLRDKDSIHKELIEALPNCKIDFQ